MRKLSHFYGLLTAMVILALPPLATAQDFIWAPDFPVGTSIPAIEAEDQDGVVKTFDDLKGEKGLLLMLSRSFDW